MKAPGYREVDPSTPRVATPSDDGGREPAPHSRRIDVDGKRIECRLDRSQAVDAAGPLVLILGYEDTEVQLGDRGDADRRLDVARRIRTDEDRCVEHRSDGRNGSINPAPR